MEHVIKFALWLFRQLLRLYPRRARETFADEMVDVFRQHVQVAAAAGWRDLLVVLGRELRDWPFNCLREHLWERNRRLLQPHRPVFGGWGAVAAALPFLLYFLPLRPSRSLWLAFLSAGVLVAWWQRWPGWVASWLGFLILFGQNWLPYSLLGNEPGLNTVQRLLSGMSEVVIQTAWLIAMYLVVRRWPRHGALVFLPFVMLSWAFTMEFASGAMTAVVYGSTSLILALTAVVISVQRTTTGDLWALYGGTLLSGVVLTGGAVLFSPGVGHDWSMIGTNLLQALAPFAGILLLQALNAWGRENGPSARRSARLMTWGALLAWMALLALRRMVMPADLEAFQPSVIPALLPVWLLGVLLILTGSWRLHLHFASLGKRYLVVITMMLVLLSLLYRPPFLTGVVRSLVYDHPTLSMLQDLLPMLQIADSVIVSVGAGGLLLMPFVIGRLRQQTAAFPASQSDGRLLAWWQRRRERRAAKDGPVAGWPWRKRLALFAAPIALIAGGVFLATVFLPLQLEAEPYTAQVALGDLDGDGDLDAVLANTMRLLPNAENKILYNDGSGRFTDSGHTVSSGGTGVVLLDSDADGDQDVVLGGMVGVSLYLNNHTHFAPRNVAFSHTPQSGASEWYFQAGDLNGDGQDDVFMAGCCGIGLAVAPGETEWIAPANRVLFGAESGLVNSGQALGTRGSQAIALGDLDGDGDLDAFVGNTQSNREGLRNDEPNEVWLNDGDGNFSDSHQHLGRQRTYAVALGDVDGDGDLDALVGNEGADELWRNGGDGRFYLDDQAWSSRHTLTVSLSDLDGDGDLDAVTGHQILDRFAWWRHGLVWWNDGDGAFTQGDQRIRYAPNAALALGDVNGDGMPDIVSGALDEAAVWLNDGHGRFREGS